MNGSLKIFIAMAFVVALAAFTGCKKDDETTETKPSLEGDVKIVEMPAYVLKNDIVTLDLGGITYPSEGIVYKWYAAIVSNDSIIGNKFTFRTPDSLGTFTVSGVAQYPGYYSKSVHSDFTTIDITPETSLKGLKYSPKAITDERDGSTYQYVTIGSLDWFAQNLAWDGAGVPFKYSPATATLFGRYYNWNEATGGVNASGLGCGPQGVCPKGWSVPTNEDWADLAKAMSDGKVTTFADKWAGIGVKASAEATFNDEKLWPFSPDNLHTNDFGWNALPTGSTMRDNLTFSDFSKYGFWWSSTEKTAGQAYYRYIFYDADSFPMSSSSKDGFGASVRCVRLSR